MCILGPRVLDGFGWTPLNETVGSAMNSVAWVVFIGHPLVGGIWEATEM